MRSFFLGTSALVLLVAGSSSAAISDASFELPSAWVGYHLFRPDQSPWSFVGSAGVARPGWQSLGFSVPDGQQVGFLQGGDGGLSGGTYSSGVQQSLSGLTPLATYRVTFYAACPENFRLIEADGVIVTADGMEVGRVVPGSTFDQYVTSSFVAPASGSVLLTFIGRDPNPAFDQALTFLDGVVISSVPEPATGLLIGVLLPSAAAMRRGRGNLRLEWTATAVWRGLYVRGDSAHRDVVRGLHVLCGLWTGRLRWRYSRAGVAGIQRPVGVIHGARAGGSYFARLRRSMPNLIQAIITYPTVNAFRRLDLDGDWEDPRSGEYAPEPGEGVADADRFGYYVLGAMNIRSKNDVRRCYMDVSMPERINSYAYVFESGELHYDYPYRLGGEFIPAIAIDGFGVYDLFYSKIAPERGIDVLRRGLAASKRKHFIAEDLGYILRDEGRIREAVEMFEVAADEEVSSYFVYGELAQLYRKLGETERHEKYAGLFERGGG